MSRHPVDDPMLHPMSAVGWNPTIESWFAELWSPTTVALHDSATREGTRIAEVASVEALQARLGTRGIDLPPGVVVTLRAEEEALVEMTGGFRYEGRRMDGDAVVDVVGPHGLRAPLTDVVRREVNGFEWGYRGGGPSDLAASLVDHQLGRPDPALARELLTDFVERLDPAGWTVPGGQLRAWMADRSMSLVPPDRWVPLQSLDGPALDGPAISL